MRGVRTRFRVAAFLLAIGPHSVLPTNHAFSAPRLSSPQSQSGSSVWLGPSTVGAFEHRMREGRAICLSASEETARGIRQRDESGPFSVLLPESDPSRALRPGLKILLRATPRLQAATPAAEALKLAAARWETVIQTPLTIVVDVDFGPTLFGNGFDDDVVAATDAQVLGGNCLYPALRSTVTTGAYRPEQSALFDLLPVKGLPTDRGLSSGLVASSASLRAVGLLNPAADIALEASDFGPPPAIGFNSRFDYDFDANDGIDPGRLDFEAIAVHEIGHVLGFISFVGQQESDPSLDLEPSLWDLFRIRPDSAGGAFTSAPRISASGGEQIFYNGGASRSLSTGRPDGTGGDARQASHWKDDNLAVRYLGVMDPTIAPGERQFLTDADVDVLDTIGYRTKTLGDPTIVVPIASGAPQTSGIIAPPPGLGALSHTHYSILVPRGATELRIELNGTQDIDLFARFAQPVFNNGHIAIADYVSRGESGSETITITESSFPPLRPGIYYIAVANLGPGDSDFTLRATVEGGDTSHAPAIFNLKTGLDGDVLALDCVALDRDGDFAAAEVSLLDDNEETVGSPKSFTISAGNSTRIQSHLAFGGIGSLAAARRARVVLIDRAGNRSADAIVDLSRSEPVGLNLNSASFSGSKLVLKVRGITEGLEVEINGRVVAPPRKLKLNAAGTKLTVKGDSDQLGLQQGANQIRVKNVSGWSNALILDL